MALNGLFGGQQDGVHTSSVKVRLADEISEPRQRPVFNGVQTGLISESDDIGTLVLKIQVINVNRTAAAVTYTLLENPDDAFQLDSSSGELRTAKMIDRESLDLSGFLVVKVRATAADGHEFSDHLFTVVVQDANDEAPKFNQNEYFALVPENLPSGTPLNGLHILATDRDSVRFKSCFKLLFILFTVFFLLLLLLLSFSLSLYSGFEFHV